MDILRGGWAPGLLGNGAGLRADSPSTGGSYQAETDAIAAAFTTPPTTARKDAIDAAVVALKTSGVWAKLDALYAFAAADRQAAIVNWKAPGTYNCTEVNAPAFAADLGFTGALTKYLDSGFNATTAITPQFTQNSATVFGWNLTNVDNNAAIVGLASTTGTTYILPRTANTAWYAINSGGDANVANTDASGLLVATRTGASATALYRNGTSIGTSAQGSVAPINTTILFLSRNGFYWPGIVAAGGIGSQLSAADNTALYNALNGYLATIKIVSAFTTPPTQARQALIQNCVTSLMTAGVWDKLDTLYAFAAADSQAAKVNWKAPGTFNATEVNAPAFAADLGFTGAATKYLDTGFNATTAPSPQMTVNSGCLFVWSNSALDSPNHLAGISGDTSFMKSLDGGNALFCLNTGGYVSVANPAGGLGLFTAVRESSATLRGYRNGGVLASSGSATASAHANANFKWLMGGGAQYWLGQLSAAGLGSQLSAADVTALYNALRTYMTGVGVP